MNKKYNFFKRIGERDETLLHIVCRQGHLDALRTLIEIFGCSLKVTDKFGNTPCHTACENGQVEIMDYLYQCPISFSCSYKNYQGETWLHLATKSDNIQLMRLIAFNTIKVERQWSKLVEFNDDILYRIFSGNKFIKLPNDFIQVFAPDKRGYTPLHTACLKGELPLLDFYLAELDLVLNFNFKQYIPSVLMLACEKQYEDVIKYLSYYYHDMPLLSCPNMEEYLRSTYYTRNGSPFCNETIPFFKAKRGDLEFFQLLSQPFTSFDISNERGDTLLHAACISCDLKMVTTIFQDFERNSVDPYSKNGAGNTCLHIACEWGSYNIAEFFINKNKAVIHEKNSDGETPLHIAFRRDRTAIVQLLIDNKADLAVRNKHEESMLHIVTCNPTGLEYMKKYNNLLKVESLNLKDVKGDTPLFNAFRNRNKEMIFYLFNYSSCDVFIINHMTNETVANIACRFQWKDVLLKLLLQGAHPVKLQNYMGQTLIHIACWINSYEHDIVEALAGNQGSYDISADINLLDNIHGCTPLQRICIMNNSDLFSYMLDVRGCFPDTKDKNGNTVLHMCCKYNLVEMAKLCLKHCSVTVRNLDGNTPLHLACKEKNLKLLKALLQSITKGQRIDNFINKEGENIFHVVAAQEGTIDILKYMVQCKLCNPTYTGRNRNTALHFAFRNGVIDNAEYLLKAGYAKDLWYNDHMKSPLCLAADNHQYDFLRSIVSSCGKDMLCTCCDCSPVNWSLFGPTIQSITMPLLFYLFTLTLNEASDKQQATSLICDLAINTNIYSDINELKDSYDNTILHYLAINNYHKTFENIYDSVSKKFADLNCVNKGYFTPLHCACSSPQDWMVFKLLENNEHNAVESLNKDSFSGKPLILSHKSGSHDGLLYLVAQGSAIYNNLVFSSYSTAIVNSLGIGIIVLGNSGVGKTTLIETLRMMIMNDRKAIEIDKPTTGLVTNEYVNPSNNYRYIFYDFAGQIEFETTHSVLLENLMTLAAEDRRNSFAFFLLVKGTDSLKENKEQIDHWLSFVRGHVPINTASVHLFLICSHDDIMSDAEKEQRIRDLTTYLNFCDATPLHKNEHPLFLNSKEADTSPACQLMAYLEDLFISCEPVNSCMVTNELLYFIQEWFPDHPCQVKDLISKIKQNRIFSLDNYVIRAYGSCSRMIIPQRLDAVVEYLDKLFCRSDIMLLKPPSSDKSEWWIIGKKVQRQLFSNANSLFSPKYFPDSPNHSLETFNTGVVPYSKLNEIFSSLKVEIDLILNYMISVEFCKEISDSTAEIIGFTSNQTEKLFFFPGLIKKERESNVYDNSKDNNVISAFLIENKHKWGLRFLHNLLLHLTYKFAVVKDDHYYARRIHVWKNGLFMCTDKQIELIVELKDDQHFYLVCRSSISSQVELAELRSKVFQVFHNIEQNIKDLGTIEFNSCTYVLYPPPQNYSDFEEAKRIPLEKLKPHFRKEVKYRAHFIEDTNRVLLNEILCFEPYVGIEFAMINQRENSSIDLQKLEMFHSIPELKDKITMSASQFHQIIEHYSIFSADELATVN